MAGYIRIDRKMVDKTFSSLWARGLREDATLVISNDKQANNQVTTDLLMLTKPANISKVMVRTLERSARIIRGEVGTMSTKTYYFIVNSVADAYALCKQGPIKEINFAAVKAKGTNPVTIAEGVTYDAEDKPLIEEIKAMGTRCYYQNWDNEAPIEL